MIHKISQFKQITNFLSSFTILEHNNDVTVIASDNHTYLIRNIEISQSSNKQANEELDQIIKSLSQHQTFHSKNILSLIDFQIIYNKTKTKTKIRAVYQYGQKSLAKEIQQRKHSEEHFDEEGLWGLLYSLASPLAYLQERNIIYGVIDSSRIFLDNNMIAILDPSSTAIDPYEIIGNRLYSPQLLDLQRNIQQLNMLKSDVYVLGLLMLQCALLKIDLYECDENLIKICLAQIREIYSENLCQIIEAMLQTHAEVRPSFKDLLKIITDLFQISIPETEQLQHLKPDYEDKPNEVSNFNQHTEQQNFDILETQYVRFQQDYQPSFNQLERSNLRFCKIEDSRLTQSPIQETGQQFSRTTLRLIEDTMAKPFKKNRKIYKSKQIKHKLIKQDFPFEIEKQNFNQTHRRSKTSWQQENWKSNQAICHSKGIKFGTEFRGEQISKQSSSSCHSIGNSSKKVPDSSLNKQNLFTKPQLMKMIKNDIKKIEQSKNNCKFVHFRYVEKEQKENQQINIKQEHKKNQHINFKNEAEYANIARK